MFDKEIPNLRVGLIERLVFLDKSFIDISFWKDKNKYGIILWDKSVSNWQFNGRFYWGNTALKSSQEAVKFGKAFVKFIKINGEALIEEIEHTKRAEKLNAFKKKLFVFLDTFESIKQKDFIPLYKIEAIQTTIKTIKVDSWYANKKHAFILNIAFGLSYESPVMFSSKEKAESEAHRFLLFLQSNKSRAEVERVNKEIQEIQREEERKERASQREKEELQAKQRKENEIKWAKEAQEERERIEAAKSPAQKAFEATERKREMDKYYEEKRIREIERFNKSLDNL